MAAGWGRRRRQDPGRRSGRPGAKLRARATRLLRSTKKWMDGCLAGWLAGGARASEPPRRRRRAGRPGGRDAEEEAAEGESARPPRPRHGLVVPPLQAQGGRAGAPAMPLATAPWDPTRARCAPACIMLEGGLAGLSCPMGTVGKHRRPLAPTTPLWCPLPFHSLLRCLPERLS